LIFAKRPVAIYVFKIGFADSLSKLGTKHSDIGQPALRHNKFPVWKHTTAAIQAKVVM
jgi:hypothetical protein